MLAIRPRHACTAEAIISATLPSGPIDVAARGLTLTFMAYRWAAVGAVLVAVMTGAAPPTAADPGQDGQFFQVLDKYQLGYASREDAIDAAGSTCAALDRGVSFGQLETILIDHSGGGGMRAWTARDADQFLFASASAYCPQFVGLVPQASLVPR